MMDQGLFRFSDPRTSSDAGDTVKATELEAIVLEDLRRRGDATTFELARRLNRSLVSISPRMRPLADKGLVIDSGRRARGPSGRNQIIWQIVS